jgi:diguanylate cyclase (GGDEF)-like protein
MALNLELKRCRERGANLAVVVCDLDGFKQINDRFGHPQGDTILRYVAAGLRSICRPHEIAARMGGDEFVLIIPHAGPDGGSAILEQRISEILRVATDASKLTPEPSFLSFSVGAAVFPADGLDADTLLSQADQKMYCSKRDSRDRLVAVYELAEDSEVATTVIQ